MALIRLEEHPLVTKLNSSERLETICKINTTDAMNIDEMPLLWDDEKVIGAFGDFVDYFYFDKLGKKYFLYIKA